MLNKNGINNEESFLRYNMLFRQTLMNEACDILSLEHSKEMIHISTTGKSLPEEGWVDVNNGRNMQTISKVQ